MDKLKWTTEKRKVHQNVLTFYKEAQDIKINPTLKNMLENGVSAVAHQNILMFKKPEGVGNE